MNAVKPKNGIQYLQNMYLVRDWYPGYVKNYKSLIKRQKKTPKFGLSSCKDTTQWKMYEWPHKHMSH